MASLACKNGRWSLQFRLRPNVERATVALGAVSNEVAEEIRARVGVLVDALRADSPPDHSTAKWVRDLPDALHAKLAKAGLVVPRGNADVPTVPLLAAFIDSYTVKRQADTNPGTRINYGQAKGYLVEHFGATRPMDRITQGDAEDFRLFLLGEKKLADNTARRVCGRAKQFFAAAVRHKLIAENPFAGMKCSIIENRERDRFITLGEAAKVLEACPDAEWRLLFALSRFGGLRCPSEHLGLRWDDIDWERGRMTVRSPKTARKGKPTRVVPIFAELRPYLDAAWDQVPPGTPGTAPVIVRYRDRNSNLRTQLERIIRRAGLEPWEKLFQNLRATRATELVSQGWPEFKVCAWLGHTEAVAKKHYWQVTDEDYRQAAGLRSDRGIGCSDCSTTPNRSLGPNSEAGDALQISLHQSRPMRSDTMQEAITPQPANPVKTRENIASDHIGLYCTTEQVTPTGFEPVLRP